MDAACGLSLKQKWQDHWEKKDKLFSPSKQMNTMGVIFFWTFTASLLYTSLAILIPQQVTYKSTSYYAMTYSVYFILFQSAVNWFLAANPRSCKVTSDHKKLQSNSDIPEGWTNCVTCQLEIPPRAHHCKICNMCVLKRDHHCFFTGTCVGFHNQRNFIVFIFYIAIGSVYGIILTSTYLSSVWPILTSAYGFNYIPFVAFWKFILGYVSGAHLLLLVQFYICCGMFVVAGWFFALEMYTVFIGITWHEAEKGTRKYQGPDIFTNIRSVFGPFWLIQFFLPIPTTQEGNAVDWKTKKGSKTN